MTRGSPSVHARRTPLHPLGIMAASAAMMLVGLGVSPAYAQESVPPDAATGASNGAAMVNQIIDLREQMRQMQGQIEELQHQMQQLQQTGKDQYLDLDSRIGKLEGAAAGAADTPAASAKSAPGTSTKAAPAAKAPAPATQPMSAADKAAAQTAYDAAFASLRAGNYVDSAHAFRAFIATYPQSDLVPNAYYWLGGSYFVTGNYQPALQAFQALLEKYPDSAKAPDARLRLADSQIALKDYAAGRATLEAVIKANPGTPLEQRARAKLQDIPAPAGGN